MNELIDKLLDYEDIIIAQKRMMEASKDPELLRPLSELAQNFDVNQPRKVGSAGHLDIEIADDFDEPLDDFAEYM